MLPGNEWKQTAPFNIKSAIKIKSLACLSLTATVWQASEPPQPAQQTEAEVKVHTNGKEEPNGHPSDEGEKKKKLNKRERKEARQQKNGKATKGAENTVAQELEKEMVGKKKKDRKRKQLSEEPSDDDDSYGTENETSSKKTKGESRFLKC